MENEGPLTTEKSKTKPVSAHEVLMEVLSEGSGRGHDPEGGSHMGSERSQPLGEGEQEGSVREGEEGGEELEEKRRLSVQTVKQILELICDESVRHHHLGANSSYLNYLY